MAFYVYIVTNKRNGTLYTGQTNDLIRRTFEHRTHAIRGFSSKYDCTRLVWYEVHEGREGALIRERQIKEWKRIWKLQLIEEMNPDWDDLYETLQG